MRPRSLAARLFLAIALVSAIALALGVWLVERAMRVEVRESVTITRPQDGPPQTNTRREVTRTPAPGGPGQVRQRVIAAVAVVLLGTGLATGWLAQRIVRPVATLRKASERIAQGDRATRVDVRGTDELAALGTAFNRMAEHLDAAERRRNDLTNDIAHELRTPLTNLRCHLEALADGVAPITADSARALLGDVVQLQHIVEDLGDIASADAGQLALALDAVPLAPIVAGLAKAMGPRLESGAVALRLELADALPPLHADAARLGQVLRNLLDNAITHTPRHGEIRVTAQRHDDRVEIVVADTGPGIPPEQLDRIFDRFYRADPSRARSTGGAGLGLAIVRQIVERHGGRVHATSSPGRGATFVVAWPVFIESSQPRRLMDG